jgi:hypothetical protein
MNPTPVSVEKEEIMRDANATVADSAVQGTDSLGPRTDPLTQGARAAYEERQSSLGRAFGFSWDELSAETQAREIASFRAGVGALREPTEAMEEAGDEPFWKALREQRERNLRAARAPDAAYASHPFIVGIWSAMIDALVKEPT